MICDYCEKEMTDDSTVTCVAHLDESVIPSDNDSAMLERYVKRTTDEWTEDFFDEFSKEVDIHIRMLTDLDEEPAYRLRRLIMISLRHGTVGVYRLTEKIDRLEAELARLRAK